MSEEKPELPIKEIKKKDSADDSGNAANEKANAAPINQPINPAAPNLPPTQNHETDGHKKTHSCRENIKFIAEILGIVGGLIGVAFLVAQYGQMVRATNASVGQLKAMQDQSGVLQEQLAETHKDFIEDERAWVICTDVLVETNQDFLTFKVEFKNSGKTPAIKTLIQNNIVTNKISESQWYDIEPTNRIGAGLMAPNEVAYMIFNKSNDFILHNNFFYAYGTVWYEDIFRNPHWSQYCWFINWTHGPSGYLRVDAGPNHNSCDDVETNQTN